MTAIHFLCSLITLTHFFPPAVIIIMLPLLLNGQCAFQADCSLTAVGRVVKFNALEHIDHLPIPVL